MSKRKDLTGQTFGNRLIVKNTCSDDDWKAVGRDVPNNSNEYSLGKCLNCGAIVPTYRKGILRNPPVKCVMCSGIGNHHHIKPATNSWVVNGDDAICNVMYKNRVVSFVVDSCSYEIASKYTWRISQKKNKYYVVSGSYKKGTMIYIHQLILGRPADGFEIDHIDGNSLNNRASNLRYVTHQENVDNIKSTRIDNDIGIRGVSFSRRDKKYRVDFNYHGDRIYFKQWDTVEEAVYCRKCIEEVFDIHMVENNPLYSEYELSNDDLKKDIMAYVLSKISRK